MSNSLEFEERNPRKYPAHQDALLRTLTYIRRPDPTTGKVRFRCEACREGGDLWDVLKRLYPGRSFAERKQIEAAHRREFKRQTANPPHPPLSQEFGDSGTTTVLPSLSPAEVFDRWWNEFGDDREIGRRFAETVETLRLLAETGVVSSDLARYFENRYVDWRGPFYFAFLVQSGKL